MKVGNFEQARKTVRKKQELPEGIVRRLPQKAFSKPEIRSRKIYWPLPTQMSFYE
jgi:hypothetical protein